jgi:predicted permease
MTAPRWAAALLRRLSRATGAEADVLIGDLEEAHRARVARRGAFVATLLTTLETMDITFMLIRRRMRIPHIAMSWLDLKLAFRMLLRYPVLTLVGSGSLAFAIAIGAAAFAFISLFLWPRMPLPDGDEIVLVQHHDRAANQPESRVVADFLRWRGGTTTLTDVAAGRGMARNLLMGDGLVEPISVAEVTASTFAMARVAPIRGRSLTDADASAAAPPVVIIGERIWRERFGADPDFLGRTVLIGDVPTAVVGVMPAAFRFPSTYEVWQPLKISVSAVQPRAGMGVSIWARMRPGVTPEQANADLTVLSAQHAAAWPATHASLVADVQPATWSEMNDPEERGLLASMNGIIALMVLLVSGNVALLMFARAATRESEIVVRTALGASRARLIGQFVAEALVLNILAAIAGLAIAQRVMHWGLTTFVLTANDGQLLPFWITSTLPPMSIAYGVGLAMAATLVTGILPAMKMTSGVSSRLRETTAGGGGLRFGGVWTVLIVAQIAVTATFPAIAFIVKTSAWPSEARQIGVPTDRYLTAELGRASEMTQARFEAAVRRVREDLAATSGIARVALADRLPLMWNGHHVIEVYPGGEGPADERDEMIGGPHYVNTAAVEPDFFTAFEALPIAGRLLGQADNADVARVAVVNESFVRNVLGGRNAIGRRLKYRASSGGGQLIPQQQWIDIVGVVRDLGMSSDPTRSAGIYLPLNLQALSSVRIAGVVAGDMTAATNALRAAAAKADAALRIGDVQTLAAVTANGVKTINYIVTAIGMVSAAALVLALSGLYAVMSFTVSRRTREIGIRVALGSPRSRVVVTILRRPLMQLTFGAVFGALLTVGVSRLMELPVGFSLGLIAVGPIIFAVCLLACIVPAWRALRVDPIAALRAE